MNSADQNEEYGDWREEYGDWRVSADPPPQPSESIEEEFLKSQRQTVQDILRQLEGRLSKVQPDLGRKCRCLPATLHSGEVMPCEHDREPRTVWVLTWEDDGGGSTVLGVFHAEDVAKSYAEREWRESGYSDDPGWISRVRNGAILGRTEEGYYWVREEEVQ